MDKVDAMDKVDWITCDVWRPWAALHVIYCLVAVLPRCVDLSHLSACPACPGLPWGWPWISGEKVSGGSFKDTAGGGGATRA